MQTFIINVEVNEPSILSRAGNQLSVRKQRCPQSLSDDEERVIYQSQDSLQYLFKTFFGQAKPAFPHFPAPAVKINFK
jgi:hypothetical protein